MKSVVGMTLLEVIVAIVVLVIGVLAAATMQTNALRATNDARAVQNVTEFARREIELRRQFDLSSSSGTSPECVTEAPAGASAAEYKCRVQVRSCTLSGSALSCGSNVPNPLAYQITVTVGGPREKTITLQTIKASS